MSFAEELKKDLNHFIQAIKGLETIIITDRDGIPLVKASSEMLPDHLMRPSFLASASVTSDQASKFGCGKCNSITCIYDTYQIIHFNKPPVMITLIATDKCNTGLLLSLESQFEPILGSLKKVVEAEVIYERLYE